MTRLLLCLGVVAVLTSSVAQGAVKPWLWTPAQATKAIKAQGDDIYMDDKFNVLGLDSVTCRGLKGKGRFTTFRCGAVFEGERVNLIAKTRRAGGLCWSTKAVSAACLAPGKRVRGSAKLAKDALTAEVGQRFYRCLAEGLGYYVCIWQDGETPRSGTVIFTPQPVVKVL